MCVNCASFSVLRKIIEGGAYRRISSKHSRVFIQQVKEMSKGVNA